MSQHFHALEHERDYFLFCSKKETDVKTVLHGAQVSAWHESGLSSQIYTENKVEERKQEPD